MPRYPGTRYAQMARRGQQGPVPEEPQAPPTQWGQAYKQVQELSQPHVPQPATPAAPPPMAATRPPVVGSGTRAWLAGAKEQQNPYMPIEPMTMKPPMPHEQMQMREELTEMPPGDEYKRQQMLRRRSAPRFSNQY